MKHNLALNRKELSILHRAIKVYHIDLVENNIYDELDHKLALKTVKAKINNEYNKKK
jgi:hypothetical protein